LREEDSKRLVQNPLLDQGNRESDFVLRYEGYGEKCILQPLSRAAEAARQILSDETLGKNRGIFETLADGTASKFIVAERGGFELMERSSCSSCLETPDFTNKWLEKTVERTARSPTQCRSNQVSGRSLRKTGIFAEVGGDFRQLAPEERRIGSRETKPSALKAPISGLISRFLASPARRWNAWLATQCRSHLSPAKFPANREFYRDNRDFRPRGDNHKARNRCAAGTFQQIP
jgi:hypothetical protein